MVSFLDSAQDKVNNIDVKGGLNVAQKWLNENNALTATQEESFKNNGFALPPTFSSDGTGLPFSKVKTNRNGNLRRNIITWFVPEFGTVQMYMNPNNISYSNRKLIQRDRTKGGYALQYWGEDLTTLGISGSTGSSGVEGINVLYEVYRAEQYAFDPAALMIAANNASQNAATSLVSSGLSYLGDKIGGKFSNQSVAAGASTLFTSGVGGILGLNSPAAGAANNDYTTLAELAFTVEMFYNGWVFRGFFESMNITERDLLFDYSISFIATQRRGYRANYLPWQRTPKSGASQYSTAHSFFNEM